MANKREPINLSMSFLDLLCSGLGGVAMIVILFAAVQRNNHNAANLASQSVNVSVELLGPAKDFEFGREIGLYVKCGPKRSDYGEGPLFNEPGLRVAWGSRRHKGKYNFTLRSDPNQPLEIGIWVRQADPQSQTKFINVLITGKADLRLKVQGTHIAGSESVTLAAANGFFNNSAFVRP
jgi:hypothetical protein